jgi:hypothetical protein
MGMALVRWRLLLALVLWPAGVLAEGGEGERTLFVALDAVPYDLVARLTDPGRQPAPLFPYLRGPSVLVTTFPSFTTVAFTGILGPFGVGPAPGYEARFFDRERNRLRGAGFRSYYTIPYPWRRFFDWKIKSFMHKGLGYLRPFGLVREEISRGLAAFRASTARRFFIYIGNTDAIGHMLGREGLTRALEELDRALTALREE